MATVSSSGRVTAEGEGSCTITVKTKDGGYKDTCEVYVEDEGKINFRPTSMTLYLDRTDSKTVTVTIDGDDSDIVDVTWESEDDDIAYIYEENFDYDEATATIIAGSDAEDGDTCIFTVYVQTEEDEYEAEYKVRIRD